MSDPLLILAPYFGDKTRFRPLLDRWRAAFAKSGCRRPVVLLTDELLHDLAEGFVSFVPELSGYSDLIRPGQPFDVKGAMVCAAALQFDKDLLVLDLDAELERDPEPTLEPFRSSPIALPLDHGAILWGREAKLEPPYGKISKLCAGVMFFGRGDRSRLVAGYRRAWLEIKAHAEEVGKFPWSPGHPNLLEQYAWALCAHRRGGKVLPATMNWAPHFVGENEFAVVNHRCGHQKWIGDKK